MSELSQEFQAAQEIGKIYQSMMDKKALCDFFLESASQFVGAESAYMFLVGKENRLWLEAKIEGDLSEGAPSHVEKSANEVIYSGKPQLEPAMMTMPLLVRNGALGVVCFVKASEATENHFSKENLDLANAMATQAAGALKSILLFEENIHMAKLATVGQTMGMVLHEIKNIMQLAKLSFDFIKKGEKDKNEKFMSRGMSNMTRALREMEGFTMDMLSLTKDYTVETQEVDLKSVLDDLREDLLPKATDFEVALDFEVEPLFPLVDADRGALYRTLLNIVKNAIEASDSQKKNSFVKVRVKKTTEDKYEIRIEDNGMGMSPEVRARLFEAFFSTKGSQGTGLGLMIMQKTIQMHQGKIEVESEKGKGTTFILKLPQKLKTKA